MRPAAGCGKMDPGFAAMTRKGPIAMDIYAFTPGTTPLLVSMPHCGTWLPPALRPRLTDAAQALPDTDWHVDRLYDFAAGLGAGILRATHSRYVIDLNRPP